MTATLIKTLDNGWPTYSLRRADGRMIATTRFPFDEPALMIAKNAGINLHKLSHVKCDEILGITDKEIEVEIEMDILNEYDQPKLDANGCLMLKQQEQ
jgi:hypothetical protein